jgi:hypothetical protein
LKRLIETLGSAESGKFFDYDGRELGSRRIVMVSAEKFERS